MPPLRGVNGIISEIKIALHLRIQITLLLVFIFSRYWSKSIIRAPPGAPGENILLFQVQNLAQWHSVPVCW